MVVCLGKQGKKQFEAINEPVRIPCPESWQGDLSQFAPI